jgi:Uma2 family endonuclease
MTIAGQRLTLDEFLRLPEQEPPLEYLAGAIRPKLSPNYRHSRLEAELARRFEGAGSLDDPLMAFPEARVTIGGLSHVPDVVAIRTSRVQLDDNGEVMLYTTAAPDLAVEIVSPGQGREGQDERCRWYVANGVLAAVRVDPERRTVRVFRPTGQPPDLQGTDVVDLDDVAPGLRFSVDELFAALRPRRSAPQMQE